MATSQMTPEDTEKAEKRIVKKPYVAGRRRAPPTVIFTRKMTLPDGQEVMQISLDDYLNHEEHFDQQWEKISPKQAEKKLLDELARFGVK